MAGDVATAARAPATQLAPMPREHLLLLATALSGSFLVGISGQFVGSNIADIQGGISASADEGSWLVTAYTMALFCGIVCSTTLIATFGLRRCMAAAALLFAMAALGCAASPALPSMIALRTLQGFVAGGFGPFAFVATFMTTRGPRLPYGLALLAFILLLPGTFGPAAAGVLEDRFGWEGQFLVQAAIGAGLASASIFFMPRGPVAWTALRNDWAALFLLALALAATLLVLGQGTRRYWLDSSLIAWSIAIATGAWAGFLVTAARSPLPILNVKLLANRGFIVPILLNLLFRAGFASTAFLVPQFLMVVQGYRPLELAHLFLWAAIPQLFMFPATWWLLQRLDSRLVAATGLVLFGLGALLAADSTGLTGADQIRLVLALAGAGQVLFLVPNLIAGGSVLTAPDAPTASLMFNASTAGGTILGVALATELVTERQRFHFGALAESAGAYGSKLERIEALAGGLSSRSGDDAIASARAIATAAQALRDEAWVLSFNDGFQLVGVLLIASAAGLLLLRRRPPLRPFLTL